MQASVHILPNILNICLALSLHCYSESVPDQICVAMASLQCSPLAAFTVNRGLFMHLYFPL